MLGVCHGEMFFRLPESCLWALLPVLEFVCKSLCCSAGLKAALVLADTVLASNALYLFN